VVRGTLFKRIEEETGLGGWTPAPRRGIRTVGITDSAIRPGCAQAELLAEVSAHEQQRNLDLIWADFRNYQQGIMPAGPGARELTGSCSVPGSVSITRAYRRRFVT
jgi:hypothetical protein